MAEKHRRTVAERAQDELDKANARLHRAHDRYERAQYNLETAQGELDDALTLQEHAANHPALAPVVLQGIAEDGERPV